MSGGSVNSFSSQGSCPSPYPYNYEVPYATTPTPSSNVYSSSPDSPQSFRPHIRPGFYQAERTPYPLAGSALMPSVSNGNIDPYPVPLSSPGHSWTVEPAIRNEEPSERVTKRKNDGFDSDAAPLGQGMDPSTPFCAAAKVESSDVPRSAKQDAEARSVMSMMTLDGHGQHFHGSSAGFSVCQMSSRFRQGTYPLPIAILNDSDLWSHSLQITSERELPHREDMMHLLNLYFEFMYPFAPMFIRKSFMKEFETRRPDLTQILLLNAIFCNACWFSDDPVIKQDAVKYFSRAKIILDETYHVSSVSMVQALVLMSHHQFAQGNYSGGWLYTGMAIRISHEIGLHRQDISTNMPEQDEIRKRVWWALYLCDRFGSSMLGRPLSINDEDFSVQMPSDDWISNVFGQDVVEYPFEPETVISFRLFWTVKLIIKMGEVLNTMYSIGAETDDALLAELSKTQLPQLHNSLTSWFLALPKELMYTPYATSANGDAPPSSPTALMHMIYYTCLTMLHRPYLRSFEPTTIDTNFLDSSRSICTAAATNVCHIIDSLLQNGQLRGASHYSAACLLSAGTVHIHCALVPIPGTLETTRAGIIKTLRAAQELIKTFPAVEALMAAGLDVIASNLGPDQSDTGGSGSDIFSSVAPYLDLARLQSVSINSIYETARFTKLNKEGPVFPPTVQLHHPYGNFSMLLQNPARDHSALDMNTVWQNQISAAVAMAATNFGGADPRQNQQAFSGPVDLNEALRLEPINSMVFSPMDPLAASGAAAAGLNVLVSDAPFNLSLDSAKQGYAIARDQQDPQQQQQHPALMPNQGVPQIMPDQQPQFQHSLLPMQAPSSQAEVTLIQEQRVNFSNNGVENNAGRVFSGPPSQNSVPELSPDLTPIIRSHRPASPAASVHSLQSRLGQQRQRQQQSPPLVASHDDMEMGSPSLSESVTSPSSTTSHRSPATESKPESRMRTFENGSLRASSADSPEAYNSFLTSLTKASGGTSPYYANAQHHQQPSDAINYGTQKDMEKVNMPVLDSQAVECKTSS
ncbi:hypothetical protein BGZ68_003551 [Mortierella alpina]|nr:hypothetical protein BGZ68_003551 [Mortierella alpina]